MVLEGTDGCLTPETQGGTDLGAELRSFGSLFSASCAILHARRNGSYNKVK